MRPAAPGPDGGDQRQASGREKHSQKITVYLSAEELLDLERARLALLRYGAAADRGRIVREAIAVLLADLDARGKDSLLARRIASADIASANSASANGADIASADIASANSAGADADQASPVGPVVATEGMPAGDGIHGNITGGSTESAS